MKKEEIALDDFTDCIQLLQRRVPRYMIFFVSFVSALIICFLIWGSFGKIEGDTKLVGEIRSIEEHDIYAPQNAFIDEIFLKDGYIVSEGDLLLSYYSGTDSTNSERESEDIEKINVSIQKYETLISDIKKDSCSFENTGEDIEFYSFYQKYKNAREKSKNELKDSNTSLKASFAQIEQQIRSINKKLISLQSKKVAYEELYVAIKEDNTRFSSVKNEVNQLYKEYENQHRIARNSCIRARRSYLMLLDAKEKESFAVEKARTNMENAMNEYKSIKNTYLQKVNVTILECENAIDTVQEELNQCEEQKDGSILSDSAKKDNLLKNNYIKQIYDKIIALKDLKEVKPDRIVGYIKAKSSGYLAIQYGLEEGMLINQGQSIGKIISKQDDLMIHFYIPDYYIMDMKVGDKVRCKLTSSNNEKLSAITGTIAFISTDSTLDKDSGSRFYYARASLDSDMVSTQDGEKCQLKIGSTIEVNVITKEQSILSWIYNNIFKE